MVKGHRLPMKYIYSPFITAALTAIGVFSLARGCGSNYEASM